jgi:predicted kinase
MRLILVRGLPGSGKTTYCEVYHPAILHVEADMLTMQDGVYRFDPDRLKSRHATCRAITELALIERADVVVSNTFTLMREIAPYIEMGEKHGAAIEIVCMRGKFRSEHAVPQDALDAMAARWEDIPGETFVHG